MTTTPMPLPKIGDKIRVTDTYSHGSIATKEFVVDEIGSNEFFLSADGMGVFISNDDPDIKCTWEILVPAPTPEPTGLGAIIRFTPTDMFKGTITLLRDGVGLSPWRVVVVNGSPRVQNDAIRWQWEQVLAHTNNVEILSEGVNLKTEEA